MRVLIAFDKFKDALSAGEACRCAATALRELHPDWTLDECPLTDGGDGFSDVLTRAAAGQVITSAATGPRGNPVNARFGLVDSKEIPTAARDLLALPPTVARIAVIEMAQVSGLTLLEQDLRDPWQTTSVGTGELMRAAADRGAGAILLGIGGSATHDLGIGALTALGFTLRDSEGTPLQPPCPARWHQAQTIDGTLATLPPIYIACDVSNPLLGPNGAATVFAPQKGLKPEDHARLESLTGKIAEMLCRHCGCTSDLRDVPGTGAAGGISFGLMAAARARLLPGYSLVEAWLGLEERIQAADLIITGEGRFDESSLSGKGPGALVSRAVAERRRIHVFAGKIAAPPMTGVSLHGLTPEGTPLEEALRNTERNLRGEIGKTFE